MNTRVLRRINIEIEGARNEHIILSELEDKGENVYSVRAVVVGPENSPFEGGEYTIEVFFNADTYPFEAPRVNFLSPVYHPNINGQKVCVDFLKDQWSPTFTLSAVIKSLEFLLIDPNPANPMDSTAVSDYLSNPDEYSLKNKALMNIKPLSSN